MTAYSTLEKGVLSFVLIFGTPQKIPERVAFCGFFIALFDLAVENRFR